MRITNFAWSCEMEKTVWCWEFQIAPFPGIRFHRCWDGALKSITWCKKLRFIYKFIYFSYFLFLSSHYALIGFLEYTRLTLLTLYITWVIRNCIEDPSHGFLVEWSIVQNRFMNLDNPFDTVVHYLLIGGTTCLGHRDGFPMVSVLVHMIHIG